MRRTLFVLSLCTLFLPVLSLASEPCESLDSGAAARYTAAIDEGIGYAADAEHRAAIASFTDALRICDEDPRVDFRVAQAFEASGNCDMARFWYEEILTHDDAHYGDLIKTQRRKALEASTQLRVQCPNSIRLDFECEQPGIELALGVELVGACPLAGRVEAGSYELALRADGFRPETIALELRAEDGQNRIFLPALRPAVAEVNGATLAVRCAGAESIRLTGSDASSAREVACGESLELPEGSYQVRVQRADARGPTEAGEDGGSIDLALGEQSTLHVAMAIPEEEVVYVEPSSPLTTAGWALTGTGLALVGTGVALHLIGEDDRTAALAQRDRGSAQLQTTLDDAELLSSLGLVGVGVGGAALLSGGLLLYFGQSDSDLPTVQAFVTSDEGFIRVGGLW